MCRRAAHCRAGKRSADIKEERRGKTNFIGPFFAVDPGTTDPFRGGRRGGEREEEFSLGRERADSLAVEFSVEVARGPAYPASIVLRGGRQIRGFRVKSWRETGKKL